MTDKTAFTIDELADRWRCTRKSVIAAIDEGRLSAFTVGKRTRRVAAAEVRRFEGEMAPHEKIAKVS